MGVQLVVLAIGTVLAVVTVPLLSLAFARTLGASIRGEGIRLSTMDTHVLPALLAIGAGLMVGSSASLFVSVAETVLSRL